MIKILGVVTDSGIPVSVLKLTHIESDAIVASLIAAARALSKVLGEGLIRRVDFGGDKLLLTDTKKGYIVFALVTRAEDFIERLLRLLAKEIDSNENVEPAGGFIDNALGKKVESVIRKYVEPGIPISITDIMFNMWSPLLGAISSDIRLRLGIRNVEEKLKKSIEAEAKSWRNFTKKASRITDGKSAIRYALNGDFEYAYIASRKSEDPVEKIFCLKMGILARLVINRVAPPIEELELLASSLPEDNIYAKLVKAEFEYIRRTATVANLLETYKRAIGNITLQYNDDKTLMIAFLFVSPFIGMFGDFVRRLAEYFKDKSDLIYSYLIALYERQRILDKAHSITSYDEIRRDLISWEDKARRYLTMLENSLHSGEHIKLDKILFAYLPNIVTYQMLLTTLMESPILTLKEKLSFIALCLNIYYKYIRKVLGMGIPTFVTVLIDSLQATSKALELLYPLLTKDRLIRDFVERARGLLQDTLDILLGNLSKFKPYLENILAVISSVTANLVELNIRIPEELEIMHTLVHELSVVDLESWKLIQPHQLMTISKDLTNIMISMAIRYLEDDRKREIITNGLQNLTKIYRWFLTQGRFFRESAYYLASYLLATYGIMSDEKFYEFVDIIDGFTYIMVPDIEHGGEELAVAGAPLARVFGLAYRKLGSKEYLELSRSILKATINTLQMAGLNKKSEELAKEFKKFWAGK